MHMKGKSRIFNLLKADILNEYNLKTGFFKSYKSNDNCIRKAKTDKLSEIHNFQWKWEQPKSGGYFVKEVKPGNGM